MAPGFDSELAQDFPEFQVISCDNRCAAGSGTSIRRALTRMPDLQLWQRVEYPLRRKPFTSSEPRQK